MIYRVIYDISCDIAHDIYIHIYIFTHIYAYTYTYMYIQYKQRLRSMAPGAEQKYWHTVLYIYAYIHTHTYVYMDTYIHLYIYIYTYLYTIQAPLEVNSTRSETKRQAHGSSSPFELRLQVTNIIGSVPRVVIFAARLRDII